MKWIFFILLILLLARCTSPLQAPKIYHPISNETNNIQRNNKILLHQKKNHPTDNKYALNKTYLPDGEGHHSDVFQEKNFQIRSFGTLAIPCVKPDCLEPLRRESAVLPESDKRPVEFFTRSGKYIVEPHDTLYAISKRLHVSLRALINANHLSPPYNLHVGQLLILVQYQSHTVQTGETVYNIAHKYNVSVASLVEKNNIVFPFIIKAGTNLIIPDSLIVLPVVKSSQQSFQRRSQPVRLKNDFSSKKKISNEKIPEKSSMHTVFMSPYSRARFLWPVHGKILIKFGKIDHGVIEKGIRISAPRGALIHAADNGVVVYSGNRMHGFGTLMLIKHANNYLTAYAHIARSLVSRGEKVRRGQVIGSVGNKNGISEIDFQIRKGTHILNPIQYLAR